MSRSNVKAGRKANREMAHRAAEQVRRDRKRAREARALVHAALVEARRIKRSKKRGTQNIVVNMERLGFRALEPLRGEHGDVLRKFEPVRS